MQLLAHSGSHMPDGGMDGMFIFGLLLLTLLLVLLILGIVTSIVIVKRYLASRAPKNDKKGRNNEKT